MSAPNPRAEPNAEAYSARTTMTTERHITRDELLDRARAAYDSMAWTTALELLMAADREAPLEIDGLEQLAVSAHLVGRDDISTQTGMRRSPSARSRATSNALPALDFGRAWALRSAARWHRPVRGSAVPPR